MKHILTFTLLFLASICAAQKAEVDIDPPYSEIRYDPNRISIIQREGIAIATIKTAPDTLVLTIEDIQDMICRDNEALRALVRVWYLQALHTGRNDSQAVEIALDKLSKLLLEKLEKK